MSVAKITSGLEYNFVYDNGISGTGEAIIIYLPSSEFHNAVSKKRFVHIPLKNNHAENPHVLAAFMYECGMTFDEIKEYFEL